MPREAGQPHMYTQRKIHSGFVGALLLIAALLVFYFHTKPTQNRLNELKNTQTNLQQEMKNLTETTATSESPDALTEVEQKEFFKAIPEKIEQNVIISNIAALTKAADVTFNALTFNLQQNAVPSTVNISGGFQGPAANIIRFLKMLEVNPRKFVVKNAGVSRAENNAGLELMNLNLTFQAFYRQ